MLLSVRNLLFSYGVTDVLQGITFSLDRGERAGLVGANGVGKSTLLTILAGQLAGQRAPGSGSVGWASGVEYGYLPQTMPQFAGETIAELLQEAQGAVLSLERKMRALEERMGEAEGDGLAALLAEYEWISEQFESRGGYELDYRIDVVLGGLGLAHVGRDRRVATLSGGERARVGLASLLLRSPDVLLLDEPTNHLDAGTLDWLESYLALHRGGILVASHDRHFLNRACNRILEIDEHTRTLRSYTGSYDQYTEQKKLERARQKEAYLRQQEELADLRRLVRVEARQLAHNRPRRDNDKFAAGYFEGRANVAISRNVANAEERLRRLESDPVPRPPESIHINPDFDPLQLAGTSPLWAEGITKSYGSRLVLAEVDFHLRPGSRAVIVGPNGAGKSTLLRILAGVELPDAGHVRSTRTARIGYLDQEGAGLDPEMGIFDAYRQGLEGSDAALYSDLFRFGLFTYDETQKKVGELSVGGRRKLQIARLIGLRANLLILDEPTNHISLDVLEAFEQALLHFPGPIIAASHDRRFIQRVATEVWALDGGKLRLEDGS